MNMLRTRHFRPRIHPRRCPFPGTEVAEDLSSLASTHTIACHACDTWCSKSISSRMPHFSPATLPLLGRCGTGVPLARDYIYIYTPTAFCPIAHGIGYASILIYAYINSIEAHTHIPKAPRYTTTVVHLRVGTDAVTDGLPSWPLSYLCCASPLYHSKTTAIHTRTYYRLLDHSFLHPARERSTWMPPPSSWTSRIRLRMTSVGFAAL